jgi:hypothetical protein
MRSRDWKYLSFRPFQPGEISFSMERGIQRSVDLPTVVPKKPGLATPMRV